MQLSMEKALLRTRSKILKNKPSENVEKCITLMTDVDSRLFNKLEQEDKEKLKADLDELMKIAEHFKKLL
jgi:hypothetical protein